MRGMNSPNGQHPSIPLRWAGVNRCNQAITVRSEKALAHCEKKDSPENWIAPPGSCRSGGGGNEAAGASGVEGRIKATRQVCRL
jgi:hypothetical protein